MKYHRTEWTYEAALDAVALRRLGMSYVSIAKAIGHFHGIATTNHAVRGVCAKAKCPPVRHGNRGAHLFKDQMEKTA